MNHIRKQLSFWVTIVGIIALRLPSTLDVRKWTAPYPIRFVLTVIVILPLLIFCTPVSYSDQLACTQKRVQKNILIEWRVLLASTLQSSLPYRLRHFCLLEVYIHMTESSSDLSVCTLETAAPLF